MQRALIQIREFYVMLWFVVGVTEFVVSSPLFNSIPSMKYLQILVTVLTLTALPAFSKNLHFPSKGDPMFTIAIPDDWEPEKDEEGTLEANSPKEKVYLAAWALE